jgi:hypothetical protein
MTTIAVRDGIVAFDSRTSECDGTIREMMDRKAFVGVRHRVIYTGCGWSSELYRAVRMLEEMRMLPWHRKRMRKIDLKLTDDETEAVVIESNGTIYLYDKGGWYPCSEAFLAFGSGKDAAHGAMHMGATAQRAVEVACRVDIQTGPPVHILKVSDL